MIKKRISSIVLILVFSCGLGLLLYPTVSEFLNQYKSSVAIADYEDMVVEMSKDDYEKNLAQAKEYNRKIKENEFPATESDINGNEEYYNTLNLDGHGMIGYIKIDKLDVRLPIYHGTSEPVLQVGVGHMALTSFPVGGKGTHAVLSGHRGLPSATLFSNLDKMENGDIFYIYILDEILAYKVDQIKTVEPTETNDLEIIQGEDHVTLVTCTPYGINTHRLLVRGVRVPYEETIAEKVNAGRDAVMIRPTQVAFIIGTPAVMITLLIFLLKHKKMKGRNSRK